MPRLRRVPYTKPIPAGASIVPHKGKPHARFKGDDGKPVLAPLTKKGDRIRLLSEKWYGEYRDADGVLRTEPLSTDKTAAAQMLAALVKKAELGKSGILDPYEQHRKRPLAEHLADWREALRASGAGPKHVRERVNAARRVLDGCKFVFLGDLSASRVQTFLAELRRRRREVRLDPAKEWYTRDELARVLGIVPDSVKAIVHRHRLKATGVSRDRRYPRETAEAIAALRDKSQGVRQNNAYLIAVKQFCGWLVKDRRMPDNPLAHLRYGNEKLDRRHDRRALPAAELLAVINAAWRSPIAYRCMAGPDRAILYSVACASGFRASELASLRPTAFDLDGDLPTVTISAAEAKNGKTAVQPLPPDVAEALRGYLNGRPVDRPVWPGTWPKVAAEMLRLDLEAAGVPYVVEGPDGPLYADFHALRHSFIAMLDKSGATLKEAMQLARHSDPKLTMAVYGRAHLHDLGEAVRRLPPLLVGVQEQQAATGTDDKLSTSDISSFPPAFRTADGGRDSLTTVENNRPADGVKRDAPQPLKIQEVEGGGAKLTVVDKGQAGEAETGLGPLMIRFRAGNMPGNGSCFIHASLMSAPADSTWRAKSLCSGG
jgi:integrase